MNRYPWDKVGLRWDELGRGLASFPKRRLTQEEVDRHQGIIDELMELLPQMKGSYFCK